MHTYFAALGHEQRLLRLAFSLELEVRVRDLEFRRLLLGVHRVWWA